LAARSGVASALNCGDAVVATALNCGDAVVAGALNCGDAVVAGERDAGIVLAFYGGTGPSLCC